MKKQIFFKEFKHTMQTGTFEQRFWALKDYPLYLYEKHPESKEIVLNTAMHDECLKVKNLAIQICSKLKISNGGQRWEGWLKKLQDVPDLKGIDNILFLIFTECKLIPANGKINHTQLLQVIDVLSKKYPHEYDILHGRMARPKLESWLKVKYRECNKKSENN